jgi:hypothetical protein
MPLRKSGAAYSISVEQLPQRGVRFAGLGKIREHWRLREKAGS